MAVDFATYPTAAEGRVREHADVHTRTRERPCRMQSVPYLRHLVSARPSLITRIVSTYGHARKRVQLLGLRTLPDQICRLGDDFWTPFALPHEPSDTKTLLACLPPRAV